MNARMLALLLWGILPLATACKDRDKDGEEVETGEPHSDPQDDLDGDGFGIDEDCDDSNPYINPDAEELCDGEDNDCDDQIDEDTGAGSTWYTDADGDGWGDDATAIQACDQPDDMVAQGGDCDDADPGYNPGAIEDDCTDPNDYNCDGSVGYDDADGDGYPACEDCDDGSANVNNGATEVCDGLDNDCDGLTDGSDATDAGTWYSDADGDTYGDDATAVIDCAAPDGTVAYGGDCDDTDAAYNPGADESDCSDSNDYNCDGSVGYTDGDGDGYAACEDCDDADPAVNDGGIEVCDEVDNDCDGTVDEEDALDAGAWYSDLDEDGYGDATTETYACDVPDGSVADNTDCDDTTAAAHPGETEICDELDNDCDGTVDEDDASDAGSWYADADGDGYGDADLETQSCDQPEDYVAAEADLADTDCDDADPDNNPAGTEVCDGADNDCDGSIDEDDAGDASTWYADADGDGYGDEAVTTTSCSAPEGYVAIGGDCDDGDAAYNPGATEDDCADPADYNCDGATGYTDGDGDGYAACEECDDSDASVNPAGAEVCDDVDNDCDGAVDEADAADAGTWYADSDADGYGDPLVTETACDAPDGYTDDDNDCDDTDASVSPEDTEYCDGVDNDCDGDVDEDDAFGGSTWYADTDEDGYGDADNTTEACAAPDGYTADNTDCDDSSSAVSPAADESCDDLDNDCDGTIDEDDAIDASTWYYDGDADYYGDPDVTTVACDRPRNYRPRARDCDDTNSAVNPGASEVCDGLDNDCDGTIDDGATGTTTWYADTDEDGFGDADTSTDACDAPEGYVADDEDCDDTDEDVNPDATESCNEIDDDCDGSIDEAGATGGDTWYADADGDGYGDPDAPMEACDATDGYVANADDCDDTDADINPGATETCNEIDDDCDGSADEAGATGGGTWYADDDGDGFGDADTSTSACDAPAGYVSDDEDCDDGDADVNPDATETCNEIDDDCDGRTDEAGATGGSTWYADDDGDGFGDAGSTTTACDMPSGYVSDDEDCDDTDAAVNPDATESCNDLDDDCDGSIDEAGATGESTWYADDDGDGFGDPTVTDEACDAPSGYVDDDEDCDDTDAAVNPDATESCNDLDDDCDGRIDEAGATGESTWYADGDEDGYGDASVTDEACDAPAGYTDDDQDCDDDDADVNPGADERCNEIDDDCDGDIDESGAVDETTWYGDGDGDGYGADSDTELSCEAPSGYVAAGGDCDDADDSIFPTAYDVCDGVDQDCDGTVDEGDLDDAMMLSVDTDIGYAYSIDTSNAHVEIVSEVGTSTKVNSVAVAPDGTAYIERSGTLYVLDVCDGTFTAVGSTGVGQTCGLVFDADGVLWGLDGRYDKLVKINTTTGAATVVGSLGFTMGTCGLAYDCTNDRLIGAEGTNDYIFEVDRLTGTASNFYTTGASFVATGVEYDPRTTNVWGATGTELYEIDPDDGSTTLVGAFDGGSNLDDLTYHPVCE